MPDGAEIRLDEYASVSLDGARLTPRDLDRLYALQARGCLRLEQVPAGWRLTADATVGVLVLDRVRLVVGPKFAIAGEHLLGWLAYAIGAPATLHAPSSSTPGRAVTPTASSRSADRAAVSGPSTSSASTPTRSPTGRQSGSAPCCPEARRFGAAAHRRGGRAESPAGSDPMPRRCGHHTSGPSKHAVDHHL